MRGLPLSAFAPLEQDLLYLMAIMYVLYAGLRDGPRRPWQHMACAPVAPQSCFLV